MRNLTVTRKAVTDVRRGDILVDGAGIQFRVNGTVAPSDDPRAMRFDLDGFGWERYLCDDHVLVVV